MKNAYNEYNALNTLNDRDLELFQTDIYDFLEDVFNESFKLGYNPREISHIIIHCATLIESEIILKNAMEMRKKEKSSGR